MAKNNLSYRRIKEVGEIRLGILVGFDKNDRKKIREYKVWIGRCMAFEPSGAKILDKSGKLLLFPKVETILCKKITKTEANLLMELGYEKTAGYIV